MEGTGACVLLGGAGSCLSGGQGHVWWCVLGVCELGVILGSLSVNGWGCVPVLLVVWHGAGVQHWSLLAIGWSWVLALKRRSLGELMLIDITWGQEVSGGPMS